ncbi:GNAT family N-acetyltransferase [Kribbella sp. GL6]|uniref:GNAT family N-acetyltransferase n=1 Tax=Kribbella sp. GL6 TaxID=3419765 RepID=UPI003D057F25
MNLPEGLEARPLTLDDAAAVAVLLAAKVVADDDGENLDADDVAEELGRPGLELARDTISFWDGDQVVGYGLALASHSATDLDRVRTDGVVHPDWRGRGLGTELTRWIIDRARELHEATFPEVPGYVGAGAVATNAGATELLTGLGFEPVRYYFDMRRPLDQPVPEVQLAGGFELIPFDAAREDDLRETHFEVFSEHWGWSRPTPEAWRSRTIGSRAFRAAQSYLVIADGRIAAYVNCYEYPADTAATGIRELYIGQVGTRRPYRGRGLARAALAKVLAEAARSGYGRGALGVDAENPTGALGLYEKLGFSTHQKYVNYQLALA